MIGLLLKDLYTIRQYGKTLLFMLVFFGVISAGLDNPAVFFEGFFIIMSIMITITSFSYDALAKWDSYALSLPVTRKEVVASKYLLSLLLCFTGTAVSFLCSAVILKISPVENFGLKEHFIATGLIVCASLIFSGVLLPLTFKYGVEKSRIFLFAIFAAPAGSVIALDKIGIRMPSDLSLDTFARILPVLVILFYLLSYVLSARFYSAKEI